MPVVSSQYWNMVHGSTPDEVRQDAEGLQIMRTLGNNMAWMIKSLAAARNTVPLPEQEPTSGRFHPLNGYSQKLLLLSFCTDSPYSSGSEAYQSRDINT